MVTPLKEAHEQGLAIEAPTGDAGKFPSKGDAGVHGRGLTFGTEANEAVGDTHLGGPAEGHTSFFRTAADVQ